ncbi:MAG: recombinase family protein, partial [Actinomycetota bacterium]|nr:recombinase family protein [Actinomycetota bacterium]
VQDVLPRLADGGATLWVPEVGGPVDPGSEAHDIMLSLFGGLSRAERRRFQVRVRAAKEAQAATGRFQGGRPPYGYRLESTGVPHPNAEKARWGAELQRLAVDPETAPVVRQVFAWRAEGLGYGTIAACLDEAGTSCPSAADPSRNTHRAGRSWGRSTVAEIVGNPRYRGDDAYGRYRKVERLYDRDDPSAGFVSVLVPQPEDDWVLVTGTVPALVSAADWAAAQPARAPTSAGGRRTDTPGRYALRGLVVCTACGHLMQGNALRRAKQTTVHYRCVYRSNYPGDTDHPKTLAVAEARILPLLDGWLGQVFDRDRLDQTIETLLAADRRSGTEPGAVVEARRRAADAQARLDRAVTAITAGVDPTLMVPVTRSAQADLAKANEVLVAHTARSTPLSLTAHMIRSGLLAHQGLPGLLADVATPDERRQLYAGLGPTSG